MEEKETRMMELDLEKWKAQSQFAPDGRLIGRTVDRAVCVSSLCKDVF